MGRFIKNIIRAAKLDASLYEEVEADPSALLSAMLVVLIASVAAGIGNIYETGVEGIGWISLSALLGWFIWSFLTYFIGTKLMPEPQTEADLGQLLRTIGFSSSPGIIRIFGLIPVAGLVLSIISSIWMLIAMVVAVRQALDYSSTWRAVGVVIIGWTVQIIFILLATSLMT
jgi:hypothetical protein